MTIAVLIVGDADLRDALREQFACEASLAAREAEAPDDAMAALKAEAPNVLLIADDIPAPGPAALSRMARAANFEGPAILLASRETATTRDFEGAMRRPLRFAELIALIRERIEARALAAARSPLDDRQFCATTQTFLGADGVRRLLTEKETAILARLANERGGVVAREVLLREIWGYNASISTHTLETHIHRLRRKIENSSGRPALLLTAPSGYRLTTINPAKIDDEA